MPVENSNLENSLGAIRRFVQRRGNPMHPCELCGAELHADHEHVIDLRNRRLMCACTACAILFSDGQNTYRRVPRRADLLTEVHVSDAQWDSLLIPINLAFFFYNSHVGRMVAMYPSPAGAMESQLELSAWEDLVSENPMLAELQPDIEALLVNRVGDAREYYRLSIDRCYELIGLIRLHWRGLSGGAEVWKQIEMFFDRLKTARGNNSIPEAANA
jgi:hypothetical protein